MKWMKKLRLINWHYFIDETMEFGKQTLITGQNAAGKSTIIDALQVLLIADQRQIRFNPAAHEEAKRTMIGYLRGKIGSDNLTFLRDGDFTTYIVAEFRDDKTKESFVVGVVIDVFRDQQYEEEYFILADRRLDELDFVKPSGHLRNRDEFKRAHVESVHAGRTRTVFERNKSLYQKALLARLGGLPERFFRIFLKALSFRPIQNVREFVYDYILDKKELQLDLMRQNFEYHEKYKQELEQLQIRKDKLQQIHDQFIQCEKLGVTIREQDYVIRRLKLLYEEEMLKTYQNDLAALDTQIRNLEDRLALASAKYLEAMTEMEKAMARWTGHNATRRKKELEERINELKARHQILQRELAVVMRALEEERRDAEQLTNWQGNARWSWKAEELNALLSGLEAIAFSVSVLRRTLEADQEGYAEGQEDERFSDECRDGLRQFSAHMDNIHNRMLIERSRAEEQMGALEERIRELEQTIRDLENKKRAYPPSVGKLKTLLEQHLGGRSPVWIFCEEMEIEDEEWTNAVEGYLNTQRFDLLVQPDVFAEALSIYERNKTNLQIEGVGLVDTEKEQRYLHTADPASLASVLKTDNPIIQAHIEHLLGRVMKAADEQELRKHKIAVTRTCMVYQNLTARQMRRSVYEFPYIGKRAIARQLELKRQELADAEREREHWLAMHRDFSVWIEKLAGKKARIDRLVEQLDRIPLYLDLRLELVKWVKELKNLDMSEADRLEAEYKRWVEQVEHWKKEENSLREEKGKKTESRKHLTTQVYLQTNSVNDAKQAFENWSVENDPGLLQGALARWADAEKQTISTFQKIENWQNNQKGNITRREEMRNTLRTLRMQFNAEYMFDGPVDAEDNDAYDALLQTVADLHIPDYQQKVEKALRDSEEEFKSHFVFKLREAIEMARREFQELNYALRNFPFSKDRYYFEVKPSEKYRRFHDAVMNPMLAEKGSLFDIPDNDASEPLHELFDRLVSGEPGEMEEFTDYRNYLDYDIRVHTGEETYAFSKVLREKSGGETQTPFYIAILASFYHLYKSEKTIRLVVFDEAFNKMDEQRIQSSLRLIKQLNLQMIAAVPDEKMAHMVPEVTTTLIVANQNYRCHVDMIDYQDFMDLGVNPTESDAGQEPRVEQEELF